MKNLLLILSLVSFYLQASPKYIQIKYEGAQTQFPKNSSALKRLFVNDRHELLLVASVFKKSSIDNTYTILVPPSIIERTSRNNGSIERTKNSSYMLLPPEFIKENDRLLLKTEYFSVDSTTASIFVQTLEKMAENYIPLKVNTSQLIPLTEIYGAMMTFASALTNQENSAKLTHNIEFSPELGSSIKSLYFDNKGIMDEDVATSPDSSAKISYSFVVSDESSVNFDYTFANQGVNKAELEAFQRMQNADSDKDKFDACEALRKTLLNRFSHKKSKELIALAVDEIKWPQDQTNFKCINESEAIEYKRTTRLSNIVTCASDECIKSKSAAHIIRAGGSDSTLKTILGTEFEANNTCKKDVKYSQIFIRDSNPTQEEDSLAKSYSFRSCLKVDENLTPYRNTFIWVGGIFTGFNCKEDSNFSCAP